MGIETVLFAAFTAISAASTMNNASDQAKAITSNAQYEAGALKTEGELAGKERAKQTRYTAARQTVSFLSSGLTLEGTPSDVISETFKTGKEDVANITTNYQNKIGNVVSQANAKSKGVIAAARTEAIGKIASNLIMPNAGSIGSMFETGVGKATNALGLNSLGQSVGSVFDSSTMGPYKPFGI